MQTLSERLLSECKVQAWCKNTSQKPIQYVDKINPYCISSVRQRLKLKDKPKK